MANGSWNRYGDILPSPIVIEHFEWMGNEDALFQMCEANERLRAIQDAQQDLKKE
jgi:hypothetical protein